MAKQKKDGLEVTIKTGGKTLVTNTKNFEKFAKQAVGSADEEIKPQLITGAMIKDDLCNYSIKIIQGIGVGDHGVKGTGIVDPDMHKAFGVFAAHMAEIDGVFALSGIEVENIDDMHDNDLSDLFSVTGFKIRGSEENESIFLYGTKFMRAGGGRAPWESPKIDLVNSNYKWYNELKTAADEARREVELYINGKCTLPEKEDVEKKDKNQLSIDDVDSKESEKEFADAKM